MPIRRRGRNGVDVRLSHWGEAIRPAVRAARSKPYIHTYIHTYIHSFNLSSGGEKLAQLQTWAAAHAVSLRFKSKEPDGPKGMSLATLRSR